LRCGTDIEMSEQRSDKTIAIVLIAISDGSGA
jgi:Mg-chelatase subunit ChlD